MRIITGDECGLLKESIPELSRRSNDYSNKDAQPSVEDGVSRLSSNVNGTSSSYDLNMSRTRGIVDLAFCSTQQKEEGSLSFCALRIDGTLEKWDGVAPHQSKEDKICAGTYTPNGSKIDVFSTINSKSGTNDTSDHHGERPIAMCSFNNIIACCSTMGSLAMINANKMDGGVTARYDAFSKNAPSSILYTKGRVVNRDIASAMAMDHDGKRVAIGGRERSSVLMDIETGKNVWKAKNLPPNPQTLLQQPIWSTAMQFLSPTDTSPLCDSTNLLAVGTGYKQIQVYDVRANAIQRRPIVYTPEWDSNKMNLLDHRVTTLCQLDSNKIVVGDSAGYMNTLDLRKITNQSGRSITAGVGRFCGPAGSVRQIIKHKNLPIIACVGLDRMLRTYDVNTRKQLDCVYLKQRLNCMLFCSDETWDNTNLTLDQNEGDEDNYSSYENDMTENGDIDEEDKVEDYIDSSGDEEAQNGTNDSDEDSSDDEDISDDESSESEQSFEEETRLPATKRRKR